MLMEAVASDCSLCMVDAERCPTFAIGKTISSLTGLRFFAALWVVIFHMGEEALHAVPLPAWLKALLQAGHEAVPLFFILSGFILSHTYFDTYTFKSHWRFVYLRFARLWPLHAVSLLALVAYATLLAASGRVWDPATYSIQALPAEFAMMRCWHSDEMIWNYPSWSVHVEWFAYIFIFPCAFWLFRRAKRRSLLVLVIVSLLALHCVWQTSKLPGGKCGDIVSLFLAGAALYRLRVACSARSYGALAALGVVTAAVGCILSGSFRFITYTGFILLIFGLSYSQGVLANVLSYRPIVYGGIISYAIYMCHAVVLKLQAPLLNKLSSVLHIPELARLALLLVAVLGIASALHHLVEAPCNRWLRSKLPVFGIK